MYWALGTNFAIIFSMLDYLYHHHFDLVSPDGAITKIIKREPHQIEAYVRIPYIHRTFIGFSIDTSSIYFNFKSLLAQLGLNAEMKELQINSTQQQAELLLRIYTLCPLGEKMLACLEEGAFVGKLFAQDDRRVVKNPDYLARMFGRADRKGRPLLALGGTQGSSELVLEKIQGMMVAFLTLKEGTITYDPTIEGLLPSIGRALQHSISLRSLLRLHQHTHPTNPRIVDPGNILLVSSLPLYIRTVFARVVHTLLPSGYYHTSADLLQPDTHASGDIYELYGTSAKEIYDIPLQFYTLEPHREYVFFSDRDQLQHCLEHPKTLLDAFATAPPEDVGAACFIVKGSQLKNLHPSDWQVSNPYLQSFPTGFNSTRQALMVEHYIKQQPSYPFLKAIEEGIITSQGILFTRYFPSPLMKRMLLSYHVQSHLKGVYFQIPSKSHGFFFSQEDRTLLHDLVTFGIPVFWVDSLHDQVLEFLLRPNKASGMFVPYGARTTFLTATFFGIYGSNLLSGDCENELKNLLRGVLELRNHVKHPLLHQETPLALVTGGGPGVMEIGNKMAKELKILSCANIVDFEQSELLQAQKHNPFIEAKMTYRLDNLIERQAEFYLDFPIFVMGGIGTDFEFSLELVRHKVGAREKTPILLFGTPEYWEHKITSNFQQNLRSGTIRGSEWVSNTLFCVQSGEEGLAIYQRFFKGDLPIGKGGPIYERGFVIP